MERLAEQENAGFELQKALNAERLQVCECANTCNAAHCKAPTQRPAPSLLKE